MELIDIIILGLVQGATEFLPVSSSGHLIIAREVFGIADTNGNAIDAFLHLGTLCAVLVYYWRLWHQLFVGAVARGDKEQQLLMGKLAVGTVPAAVMGYLFAGHVAALFRTPTAVSVSLVVTAVALFVADRYARRERDDKDEPTYKDAIYIGIAQVVALMPGVSRSGMTMAAGRSRGLSRSAATRFSFLLSAPIIAGAGLASAADLVSVPDVSLTVLVVGVLAAFLSGLAAIYVVMRIVERISFTPFVVYLLIMAAVLSLFTS